MAASGRTGRKRGDATGEADQDQGQGGSSRQVRHLPGGGSRCPSEVVRPDFWSGSSACALPVPRVEVVRPNNRVRKPSPGVGGVPGGRITGTEGKSSCAV